MGEIYAILYMKTVPRSGSMKSVILFKMRLWVFLTELPPMILLMICIRNNGEAAGLFKLYPLIVALMALIIFLAFYFFRLVEVSWEEIHDIGLFTRRDDAVIRKDTALTLLVTPKGKIKLTLLGALENAGFDWVKPTDKPHELAMYRGNVYGGDVAATKLLTYFGADEADLAKILGEGKFAAEYKYSGVEAESTDEGRLIRINVTETLTAAGTPMTKPARETTDGDNASAPVAGEHGERTVAQADFATAESDNSAADAADNQEGNSAADAAGDK